MHSFSQFKVIITFVIFPICIFFKQLYSESLWKKSNEQGLFRNTSASMRGDILTIVFDSDVTTQSTITNKTGIKRANNPNFSFGQKILDEVKRHGGPQITLPNGEQTDKFDGEITIDNKIDLNTKITVMVSDVLPNGNLVFEGSRKKVIGGNIQYEIVSGIVKQTNISAENLVKASNVLNLQIKILSEGENEIMQQKGWLNDLHNTIRPY